MKEVRTIYLGEDSFETKYKKIHLKKSEREVLRTLVAGGEKEIDWQRTLAFIGRYRKHLVDLLMGEDFYRICLDSYRMSNQSQVFFEYLWNIRAMYFPFMKTLTGEPVEADVYHALSTGYAGILGSVASYVKGKPFLLSEHGIYTREREEDIIRMEQVEGEFKELWIDFFKKISRISYQQAKVVTSLFYVNKTLQVELGCPEEKIRVIPNGVAVEDYEHLVSKNKLEKTLLTIAAVLRVVPIKDVKTMLLAYQYVKEQLPNTQLAVLGGYEENPEYYEECLELIHSLKIEDVTFFGQVNIKDYLPDIDLLLLSSISEGQPLAMLEGMAAGIPFVSTNVGDCKGLLEGNPGDTLGKAGIIVPVMDSKEMAEAILTLANNPTLRKEMGSIGKKRVKNYYQKESFLRQYDALYQELYSESGGEKDGWDWI